MPDHPMSDEERVAELEQQLSAAYDYWSNRVARLEAALGPQLTAEEAQGLLVDGFQTPDEVYKSARAKLSLIAQGEKP